MKTKNKRTTIRFNSLNINEYNEKELEKLLHSVLWNMRGKYGYSNVKVVHLAERKSYADSINPFEALEWSYFEESINVVAYNKNRSKVLESKKVFISESDSFDTDPSWVMKNFKFENKDIIASELMIKYMQDILKGRLDYFKNYGLEYEFKINWNENYEDYY